MEEYDFKKEEVRMNLLTNRHNHITTCYYLLLKNKIKKGISSVSDLISEEFRNYLGDKRNLLSNFNHDINIVVQERSISPKRRENIKFNLDLGGRNIADIGEIINKNNQGNIIFCDKNK